MPKKICNFNGCNRIISGHEKYCQKHKKLSEEIKTANNKRYDNKVRHVRDKQYTEFYHSTEWVRLREYILMKYKGIDLYTFFTENRIVFATTVHHIEELKDNWGRRLDTANMFPVCAETHNIIHAMYGRDKEGTQKMLIKLLKRWEKEYGGGAAKNV